MADAQASAGTTSWGSGRLRDIRGAIMSSACRMAAYTVVGTLILILAHIGREGAGVVSWEFLSQPPTEGMTQGGIFPAIFGTI